MPDLDFPYRFSGLGRTATTDRDDHIRDLIQQVLFTSPGERVMRPDFGAGLLQLVFEPNSTTLAASQASPAANHSAWLKYKRRLTPTSSAPSRTRKPRSAGCVVSRIHPRNAGQPMRKLKKPQ